MLLFVSVADRLRIIVLKEATNLNCPLLWVTLTTQILIGQHLQWDLMDVIF